MLFRSIEKLEHQLRALEIDLNRGNSVKEINARLENLRTILQSLRDNISIENDEWN